MKYVLTFLTLIAAPAGADCLLDTPCEIGDRSYHLRLPDGWDGVTPMPVLLHFHGWGRQGDLIINHDRIASATRKRGVLLVAPNGLGRSWSFWSEGSGDTDFAETVLAEVQARYPVDPDRIFVSGYSYGGAMSWRFACETQVDVAALLSISGTIRQTETCATHPDRVHHVHGLADTVMDFPMGPEEDTTYPTALWRQDMDCDHSDTHVAWQAREWLTFDRVSWTCAQGDVTLDIHPGGHFIPHGWIARQLDDLLELPHSYP